MDSGVAQSEEIAIGYGQLFEVLLDFFIVGLTVFLVVKFINIIRNKAEDPQDNTIKTPKEIELLNEVTVLLKKQNELLEKNR